jgi:hypothetical protein
MPLFGKRKPLTDAEKQARRDRMEMIGAVMADVGAGMQGGQGNQYANLMQRRQQLAQQQQLGAAFTDLLGQMRGPDTMTPQVNELIGAANMRGAQIGAAPIEMQTPRRAGLDYTDPATMDAFKRYIMAGGNAQLPQGIAETMQAPARKFVNLGSGRYGFEYPETGDFEPAPMDALQQQRLQAEIEALEAQAGQRQAQGQAAMINANRPRGAAPRAAGGGGMSTGTGAVGYVPRSNEIEWR